MAAVNSTLITTTFINQFFTCLSCISTLANYAMIRNRENNIAYRVVLFVRYRQFYLCFTYLCNKYNYFRLKNTKCFLYDIGKIHKSKQNTFVISINHVFLFTPDYSIWHKTRVVLCELTCPSSCWMHTSCIPFCARYAAK
jgi:hypothetical protein